MNPPKTTPEDIYVYRPHPEIARVDERVLGAVQSANQMAQAGAQPGELLQAMLQVVAAQRDMIVLMQGDLAAYSEKLFRVVREETGDTDVVAGLPEETAEDLMHLLTPVQKMIDTMNEAVEEGRAGKVKLNHFKDAIIKAKGALDEHADALAELIVEGIEEDEEDDNYTPLIAPDEEEPDDADDNDGDEEEEEEEEEKETRAEDGVGESGAAVAAGG